MSKLLNSTCDARYGNNDLNASVNCVFCIFCLSDIFALNCTKQLSQINYFNAVVAVCFMRVHTMVIYSLAGFALALQNNFFSQQQLKLYNPSRGMKSNSHNSKKCYFEIKGKDDIGYLGNWQSVLL